MAETEREPPGGARHRPSPARWRLAAAVVVEIDRHEPGGSTYRTIAHHVETDRTREWTGLPGLELVEWLHADVLADGAAIAPPLGDREPASGAEPGFVLDEVRLGGLDGLVAVADDRGVDDVVMLSSGGHIAVEVRGRTAWLAPDPGAAVRADVEPDRSSDGETPVARSVSPGEFPATVAIQVVFVPFAAGSFTRGLADVAVDQDGAFACVVPAPLLEPGLYRVIAHVRSRDRPTRPAVGRVGLLHVI